MDGLCAEFWCRGGRQPFSYLVFPNPFSDVIGFSIQNSGLSFISIKIYDILGNEVMTVYDGAIKSGINNFTLSGNNLQDGIFVYKIYSYNQIRIGKIYHIK